MCGLGITCLTFCFGRCLLLGLRSNWKCHKMASVCAGLTSWCCWLLGSTNTLDTEVGPGLVRPAWHNFGEDLLMTGIPGGITVDLGQRRGQRPRDGLQMGQCWVANCIECRKTVLQKNTDCPALCASMGQCTA